MKNNFRDKKLKKKKKN